MALADYYRTARRLFDAAPDPIPGPPARGQDEIEVVDGDTIKLLGAGLTVRLARIDAPETGQPGAERATRALDSLLAQGEELRVELSERGRYGRPVCEVWIDGVNVSDALLELDVVDHY